MTATRNKKITIYIDESITPELREWLNQNGDSVGGRRLLRMGYMLEQSGLSDQIMLLATQRGMATASQFDLVAKAVELLAPLQQPMQLLAQPKPEEASFMAIDPAINAPKSSVFKAGRNNQ